MAIRRSLIGAALGAITILVHGVGATNCILRPNQTDADFADARSMVIHSQNDIDTLLQGCTSIDGGLAIASDYNGTFSLPGIGMFTGEGIWQISPPSTPGLTSFDLPDMVILTQMNLEGMPALTSISMPLLEQIESLTLLGNSTVSIDCGSLVNADTIMIEGSAPVLNFTALQQVNERLSIQAVPDTTADAPSSTLNFDSLQNATSISIVGHIAQLNMPNLEIALPVTSGVYSSYGIDIENFGDPLVVDFPSLYNASGIKLEGNFASLSFPSLLTLDGVFALYSNLPFSVNFTTLQSVLAISLEGKISSFSMPSVKDIQSWVEVTSSVSLDCSTAQAQWKQTNSSSFTGSVGGAHTFSCETTAKKHLSAGAKVGMAFGLMAVLGALIFTIIWSMKNWWSRKARNAAQNSTLTGHELGDMYKTPSHVTTSERPPPYAASVHSEIGPLAEPKSAF